MKKRTFAYLVLLLAFSFGAFLLLYRATLELPETPTEVARLAQETALRDKAGSSKLSSGAESKETEEKATKLLWTKPIASQGEALDQESTAFVTQRMQGKVPVGRTLVFDQQGLLNLAELKQGDRVSIVLPDGEVSGLVNLVQTTPKGTVRVGGGLGEGRGSFSLSQGGEGMAGRILLRNQKLAYVVSTTAAGQVQLREMALGDVMCYPLPRAEREGPQAAPPGAHPEAAPPEHRSRPGATAVLYLDFDGATVTDPDWDPDPDDPNNNTINAAASSLSSGEIAQVFHRVAEDFMPFNINVTTVESDYSNAPVGRRMRVIITPTDAASPGAGGVAWRDTFSAAGTQGFVNDVPCWVFNSSVNGVAEAVSHELGHTLGLKHDGRTSPEEDYYEGHGFGANSWGPIMGAAYERYVIQWSKGEYLNANNQEDDVAIIAGAQTTPLYSLTNNTGYVADEAGNSRTEAAGFDLSSGQKNQTGVISAASDADFYVFTTSAPQMLSVSVVPSNDTLKQPNLDASLEVQDAAGTVLASANPVDGLNVELHGQLLPAGTYYLKISGTGRGNVQGEGYSNYGSIGRYRVNAQLFSAKPLIISSSTATIGAGSLFSYQVTATNGASSFNATGLPPGLAINTGTGLISGRPEASGVFVINLSASNAVDTGTSTLTLTVTDAPPVVLTQTSGLQLVAFGGSTSLSVTGLSANGAISYQWMKDGRPVAGATGNALTLNNAVRTTTGAYWLVMTNTIGATRSKPIFVRVVPSVTQVRAWGLNNENQATVPSPLPQAMVVAAGGNHSLALKSDGTLVGWGSNNNGQLTTPTDLVGITALAGAAYHTLALKSDGTVSSWGWGYGYGGQWNVPIGLTDVYAISAGNFHSLAVKTDGTVVAWGSAGNLPPANLSGMIAVAAGGGFSLVLKSDGTVAGWGQNWSGQITIPVGLTGVTAISAGGEHSLALKSDGTVVAWGGNLYGQANVPAGLNNVVAISAGQMHSLALKGDGTVVVWGQNEYGQTTIPASLTDVWDFSAGAYHTLVLRDATGDGLPVISMQPANKTVLETATTSLSVTAIGAGPFSYQWRKEGVNIIGANSDILLLSEITAAQGGNYDVVVTNHVGAVTSNTATLTVVPIPAISSQSPLRQVVSPGGSLNLSVTASGTGTLSYQWLRNGRVIPGATGSSYNPNPATYADNGWYVVRITDSNGTRRSPAMFVTVAPTTTQIVGWGWGFSGGSSLAPTHLTDAMAIIGGGAGYTLALRRDGTLAGAGSSAYFSPLPTSPTGFVAVVAGYSHNLALKPDGTVVSWGYASAVPAGLKDVVAIAAESYVSYALKADGTVVGWNASTGQPLSLTPSISQGSGLTHSYVLLSDGTVVKIQSNRPEVPTGLLGVKEIVGSASHTLAIKEDGTVVAWDYYNDTTYGKTTVPVGLNNAVGGATGYNHSLVLKADGAVIAWGANTYGQTDVPSWLGNVFSVAANSDFSLALRDATQDTVPAISLQPAGQTVTELQSVSFTVAASGAGPFTYQWRKGGVNIAGATSATLSLPEVLPGDAGTYDVVITNHKGSTTSNTAVLAVIPLPVITNLSPVRQVLSPGAALNLTVSAVGTGTVSYQWIHNGRSIVGATGTGYSKQNVTRADGGWYVVLLTDSNGTRRSKTMFVTIAPAKTQLVQWGPLNSGNGGSPAPANDDITTIAIGSHQGLGIRKDGSLVAWGNSSMYYSLGSYSGGYVAIAAGPYHTLMLRADGTVESGGYNQSVPAGLKDVVSIAAGYNRSFAVKSDGTLVAWVSHSGELDPFASGGTNLMAVAAGSDSALALKSDGSLAGFPVNSATSYGLPTDLTGATAFSTNGYVSAAVKADGTLRFWGQDSWGLMNVPADVDTVLDVKIGDHHTLVLKSNGAVADWGTWGNPQVPAGLSNVWAIAAGADTSLVLRDATADTAPTISSQPAAVTVAELQSASFAVTAAGVGPFAYQWRKNGVVISGATSPTFTIPEVSGADAGNYSVVVSNHVGSVISNGAALTVKTLPVVTSQSALRRVLHPGQALTLGVSSTGVGTISYQWIHNGRPIVGATGSSYSVGSIDWDDAGWYAVQITDSNGTRRSKAMFVLMAPAQTEIVEWGKSRGYNPLPTGIKDAVAVAEGGDHTMVLRADGTVVGSGYSSYYYPAPGKADQIVQITPGYSHTLFLRADGTVISTGYASQVPAGLKDVVALAAGYYDSYALKSDGRVVGWNAINGAPIALPADLANVIAIDTDWSGLHVLKADGSVISVSGSISMGSELNNVAAIAIGYDTGSVLKNDGTVVEFGSGAGVPAGLTGVVALSAGNSHRLALQADGTVVAWGGNSSGEINVPAGLSHVRAIAAGYGHSTALKDVLLSNAVAYVANTFPSSVAVGSSVTFDVTLFNAGQNAWGANHYLVLRDGNGTNVASANLSGTAPTATTTVSFTFVAPSEFGAYPYEIQAWEEGVEWFGTVQSHIVNIVPRSASDFNADGRSDLVWQNLSTGERVIWLMNGVLTNKVVSLGTVPAAWTIATSGDFNADGQSDLVWQNLATGERAIWLMNGVLTSEVVSLSTVPVEWAIATSGDFNADGRSDLVWQNPTTGERVIWLMNGVLTSEVVSLSTIPVEWTIATSGDFNADDKADLVWQNLATGERVIWLMNGVLTSEVVSLGIIPVGWAIAGAGDFNQDGRSDLIWQNLTTGERSLWLMNGTSISEVVNMSPVPASWVLGQPGVKTPSTGKRVIGDFNADNRSDILWSNNITGERAMWLMDGTNVANGAVIGTVSVDWVMSATGDYDGDSKADIFWTNTTTGDRAMWLMDGTQMASNAFLSTVPVEWVVSGTGDFNGDGKDDILWTNTNTGDRAMWLMNGSSVLGGGYLTNVPLAWQVRGTGDHNGDGKADILWSHTSTGERAMWLMNGIELASGAVIGTVPVEWSISASGDYDGDGKADIFWTNTTTGDRAMWLMNGTQMATNAYLSQVPVEWVVSGSGDYNGDGNADVVWTNTATGDRAMWFMNGGSVLGGGYLTNVPLQWTIR